MIVILSEQLIDRTDPSLHAADQAKLFSPLSEAYLDRLARQYRKLGARAVYWAGACNEKRAAGFRKPAWRPLDKLRVAGGTRGPKRPLGLHTLAFRGTPVLFADTCTWPNMQLRSILKQGGRSFSDLAVIVRSSGVGRYVELAERLQSACVVTRCYRPVLVEPSDLVGLLAYARAPGSPCERLLEAVRAGDLPAIAGIASEATRRVVAGFDRIDAVGRHLVALRALLSSETRRWPGASRVGDQVWMMPGASVDSSCILEGPIYLGRNCRVGRGAHIIGPAYIGDSAIVGEAAFVGESVVAHGGVVQPGTRAWRSVVGTAGADESMPGGAFTHAGWQHPGDSEQQPHGYASVVVPSRQSIQCHPWLYRFAKRAIDICGAIIGLVVTLPLYPFIVAAIKLDSRGPIFFKHRRQTIGGKEFTCVKFRTMVDDTDRLQQELPNEVDGPQFYIKNDPRLTRVGRTLRKTNLDELPQLWNVLLGQMSLVGPRPSPDRENQFCPGWREARLSVRPGLTGMWQTRRSTNRSAGDFHEWIQYDLQYVRECSLWNDMKLIWVTVLKTAMRMKSTLAEALRRGGDKNG